MGELAGPRPLLGRTEQRLHRCSLVEEQPAVPGRDGLGQGAVELRERPPGLAAGIVGEGPQQEGVDDAAAAPAGRALREEPVEQSQDVVEAGAVAVGRCWATSSRARVRWSNSAR